MSQHDYNIANQTFSATRTDLNNALGAVATNNAGNSAPSTTYANQWWFDSDGNTLYMRNKDNDAWVQILTIGATSDLQTITTDLISEVTSAAGVTIDGLLIKDSAVGATGTATSVAGIPLYKSGESIYTHDVSGTDSTAENNTAYGIRAMDAITTGDSNTAIGQRALSGATTGHSNVAVGASAGLANQTGIYNVFVGFEAGNGTTGSQNTFLGRASGKANTTGGVNIAIGDGAYDAADTESNNLAIGVNALGGAVAGGEYNVAIGNTSLDALTSGDNNTAIGYAAFSSLTTGTENLAVGYQTGLLTTTGDYVTFVGSNAGYNNTTGANNTALGRFAYLGGDTESNNTAIGMNALSGSIAGGEYNVAIGNYSLDALTSGDENVAVGYLAGSAITTGNSNVCIGVNSGVTGTPLTTGANNLLIGQHTRASAADGTYQFVIGYDIAGGEDNEVSIGKNSNVIRCQYDTDATWTRDSDERKKRNIKPANLGLDFVNDLNTVTFNWRPNNEFPKEWDDYSEENKMNLDATMHGMIAQDVKSALDKAGVDTFGGWKINKDGSQRLSNEMFVFPLIKAVQELSATVTTLQQEIKILKEGL
jgi:hypothetical protein